MAFRNIDNVGPAGSINSNVDDMARWLLVHLNKGKIEGNQIMNEATLSEMHTPQMAITALPTDVEVSPGSYSLGWMTDTYQGHYRVRHGGGIDGFTALVTLFPRDRLGIVTEGQLSGLEVFYGSYPITPASEILQELAARPEYGVKTFQAEDEIAAMCAVLGAGYAGSLAVTGTSGPGSHNTRETQGWKEHRSCGLVVDRTADQTDRGLAA